MFIKTKTHKNLFEQVCSFENLHSAYLKARKCKRYKEYVLKFSYDLEKNLFVLQNELISEKYRCGKYNEFIVNDSKKRLIKAPSFRDRIVHHALYSIIEPIFDKSFIHDSYACRIDKGTHRAVLRLKGFLKNPKNIYCLQCDVRKYFESIDHSILFELIKKKIADKKVLRVIKEIIDSSFDHKAPQKRRLPLRATGTDNTGKQDIGENRCHLLLKQMAPNKATGTESLTGVPLGNLTSQLFANIYLNELDQFAKHTIKAKYYIRYMDDFLILGYNKKELFKMKEEIKKFLLVELKLDLHPKKCNIFPVKTGIDFLGYRIFANYRLLRKSTVKRFIRRTKHQRQKCHLLLKANGTEKANGTDLTGAEKFFQSIASWLSYAKFGNSWKLRESLKWLWEF